MQFIKISNEAGFVNRLYLEKLGLSTKRDDEETIGQFGSGSKFAPIAALRKGIRWISVGEDERGEYQLEFVCIPENGINEIYIKYDDQLKSTSFTLEAGMLSWEDDFQIFREAFANALDESISSDAQYSIEIVDSIKNEAGKFAVYLSATPGLVDIVNNIDNYFSLNRDRALDNGYRGAILYKSNDPHIKIFNKNVLVYSGGGDDGDLPSIFDYNFSDLTLNEERRVRSETSFQRGIVDLFSQLLTDCDGHVEIAERIINQSFYDKYETSMIPAHMVGDSWRWGTASAFNAAFFKIYGEKACIVSSDNAHRKSECKVKNYKPVVIDSDFLYKILANCGIPRDEDIFEAKADYDILSVLPERHQEMFDACHNLLTKIWPEDMERVVSWNIYIPKSEQEDVLGVHKNGEIFISTSAFHTFICLAGTMIHELDHLVREHHWHDSEFRNFADDRIGKLLLLISELETI